MSEAPLKATLKAGRDFDAPWLTVDGDNANDLLDRLTEIKKTTLLEALVDTANTLKAVNSAAPIAADVASPPANTNPAGAPTTTWQNSNPAPAWAGQQQAAPAQPSVRLHPEGVQCPADGQVVQWKEITSRKNGKSYQMWTCPNQRSRGDGHYSEFAN